QGGGPGQGSTAGGGSSTGTGSQTGAPSQATTPPARTVLSSGAALSSPEVPAAPSETRELSTEHYRVTLTSDGGAIAPWIVDSYKDEIRNEPLDLVPPGAQAFPIVVEYGSRALDFSKAPFRLVQDDALGGVVGFEAQDQSGVRVVKTYKVGR